MELRVVGQPAEQLIVDLAVQILPFIAGCRAQARGENLLELVMLADLLRWAEVAHCQTSFRNLFRGHPKKSLAVL
jgi:hypothetical protein